MALEDGIVALEHLQTLLVGLVARVLDPAQGVHDHRGAQELLPVPPVRRAGVRAARAQDALVHAILKEGDKLLADEAAGSNRPIKKNIYRDSLNQGSPISFIGGLFLNII